MDRTEFETIRSLPLDDVAIDDSFWSPRLETIRDVTMDTVYGNLDETGRIDNFRKAAGELDGEFAGRFYNDSDVYKWLEAACYLLETTDRDETRLRDRVEEVADAIEAAQEDDGYLDTYFTLVEPDRKWTNLHGMHELYCAGHFFEAAVAHRRATGEDRLLDAACRLADHVDTVFGPDGRRGAPGHEEIELALVKLYRETGRERYRELARYFVDQRGGEPSRFEWEVNHPEEIAGQRLDRLVAEDGTYDGTYLQDHAPVREQTTAEGHAVRATYLYAGMADLVMETGDRELYDALEAIWSNATERRMYVTGGLGSSPDGERFTEDYDLPNETSYAETCAALGSVRWNHRMLQLTGEGRFGDTLERTLYNGLLPGLSLSGDRFFYDNPMEINGDGHVLRDRSGHRFGNRRQPWFATACCPTNVPRLLLALGRYAYGLDEDARELYAVLYVGSEVSVTFGETDVVLEQTTEQPWEGKTTIAVDPERPVEFGLKLRIPGWSDDYAVSVNGEEITTRVEDGFLAVSREWTEGDRVELELDVDVVRVSAHPAVTENADRVALQRGPLVYCIEGADHSHPLADYVLPSDPEFETTFDDALLDGVVTIEGTAFRTERSPRDDALYRPAGDVQYRETTVSAIPYYGWADREPGEMRVWLRSAPSLAEPSSN